MRVNFAVTKSPVQKYGVGLELVDAVDHLAEEEGLSEFVHVNVADLRKAHAVKSGRESRADRIRAA